MSNKNTINYRRVGDIKIPNLTLPPEETNIRLGKWGMLHKDYLLKHKKVVFATLLAEGIKGQLEGTIGSTSSTQTSDTLIDAGTLDISAMGTMGGNMSFPGGNQAPQGGDKAQGTRPQDGSAPSDQTAGSTPRLPEDFQSFFDSGAKGEIPQPPQNDTGNMQQIPDDFFSSSNTQFLTAGTSVASSLALIGVCIVLLVSGIIIASRYKRRR